MNLFQKDDISAESGDTVTVIGPEAYFQGAITVRSSLRIEGEVEGNISEAQTVVVGRKGRVRGDVCGESVIVAGSVRGDIAATNHLELKGGGRIEGDIRTPRLLIEEGSVFEGNCSMKESGRPEETLPPARCARPRQEAGA
jgi:cytoskeletal protein CcmA (bactofilin family)